MGLLDSPLAAQYSLLTTPKRTQQMALRQPRNPYMRSSTHLGRFHNRHPRHSRRPEARKFGRPKILSRDRVCRCAAYRNGERKDEYHQGRRSRTSLCEASTAFGVSKDKKTIGWKEEKIGAYASGAHLNISKR